MNDAYILMLEGDSEDQFITAEIFAEKNVNVPVKFIDTTSAFFSFLDSCISERQTLPAVMLVTMRSIPENGLSVLKQLKSNDRLKHIPVIMLIEGAGEMLIAECYAYGANSVIQKPSTLISTINKIESFVKYWFEIVELPLAHELAVIA
ncbi:MAG: hypothetical protein JWN76_2780 [Chitinophagaceae bacterium]|nr:hypothetical protein [Chitinophagaceae bacterium]